MSALEFTEEGWRDAVRRAELLRAPARQGEAVELVEVARSPRLPTGHAAVYVSPSARGGLELHVAVYEKQGGGFAARNACAPLAAADDYQAARRETEALRAALAM